MHLTDRMKNLITALAFLLLAGNAAPENVSGSCRQDTTAVDADFLRKVRAARDAGIDTLAEVRTEIAEFASALAARPDSASGVESFRNGLMVYEITRMMVDEPSRRDTAALNRYFLSHRDGFRWERPRFKGYVLAAVSDSIADIALEWLASGKIACDTASRALRQRFGPGVKVERVLSAKGSAPVIDRIVFGDTSATVPDGLWPVHRVVEGRVIDAPEAMDDVRHPVSDALRRELMEKWIADLRRRYP